ncbi:MAG: tRNA (adenosine(37)-N6)-threonylcarbamoyltransferase complex dimerization subunit type 1 TsaB [Actinomycetota bacterium]|nr:tRNA (adenosine(37)-N6)-threonylcarbamoyltransferase complex dimerization subunit type 1 TsaB [Actinomycetota bacterium]
MRLLAIETSSPASSVALGDGRRLVAGAERVDRRGPEGFLVPALDFCFDQAGWKPDDVEAVVVDVGPGLFTGIRVGLATAQGIAAAVGAPLVPATSVDALAIRAATGRRRIWAVMDVRRGEMAVASYHPVPGGVVKDGSPELVTPDGFRALLESDPEEALVVGDWEAFGEPMFRGLQRVRMGGPRHPPAEALLELVVQRVEREEFPLPEEVRPLYLREPDAHINWQSFREEDGWPRRDTD